MLGQRHSRAGRGTAALENWENLLTTSDTRLPQEPATLSSAVGTRLHAGLDEKGTVANRAPVRWKATQQ